MQLPKIIQTSVDQLSSVDPAVYDDVISAWDSRTKPKGSLGRLETLAAQIAAIQGIRTPRAARRRVQLFAGSHGITREGVSLFPNEVNQLMFENFNSGGAAISVICRSAGIEFEAIDAGIYTPTRSFLQEPAMSESEVEQALLLGWNAVPEDIDLYAVGEMGIGNTSCAAAIAAAILKCDIDKLTGPGVGIDEDTRKHKADVIHRALKHHAEHMHSPLDILRCVGGRELAAMTGALLSAASKGIPVVLDGVIATASAAIALEIVPALSQYLIAGHQSQEPAHQYLLDRYELEPLLQLNMRLGEGTGAALAMDICQRAVDCFNDMATFESIGLG
ncbi:MAG: nicotinate-nucleotide--dimethylbenzimidazole phosphoribosyltransferase [Opitutales bacterium]|nr:nicotinate-nucleotide--dimethylbenzimidazole phosphoribosyltransferase [Opitutales bacterium]